MRVQELRGRGLSRGRHLYALDLLRLLALVGVISYHFWPSFAPSGLLAVSTFFTLSGYLCMIRAIEGGERRPLLNLERRFLRLYPPLLWLLLVTGLLMLYFFPAYLGKFAEHLRSSLLGYNNWQQILAKESYFEGAAYLKPLTHLWALSLEWQFYLFFYLFVQPLYRREDRLLWLLFLGLLTLLSLGLVFYFLSEGADPSRLYYGTDTRFYSFTLGMIAALLRRESCPVRASRSSEAPQDWLERIGRFLMRSGLALLLFLSVAVYVVPLPLTPLIAVALPFYSLLSVGLIFWLDGAPGKYEGLGESRVVQYLSAQSYLIYLVHYPVLRMMERFLAFAKISPWLIGPLALVVTLVVAECSRLVLSVVDGSTRRSRPGASRLLPLLAAGLMAAVLIATPWGLMRALSGAEDPELLQAKIDAEEARLRAEQEARREELERRKGAAAEETLATLPTLPTEPQVTNPQGREITGELAIYAGDAADWPGLRDQVKELGALDAALKIDVDSFLRWREIQVSLIGDSVSVIAGYHRDPYLPNCYADTLSNRQMGDLTAVYKELKDQDLVGEILVVALSTNGDPVVSELEAVHRALAGRPLVIVNISLPYAEQEAYRNKFLSDFAKAHDNVWLVDWAQLSHRHPEFFMEDLIHPSDPLGCQAYNQLLAAKICEICQAYEKAGKLKRYAAGE